jgi:murein DD-endopeptidase MepM/ murein hydrolase activator NlpD
MKLLKPRGWVSQGFGLNDVDYKLYGYKGHPGIDFVQGFKSSIVACGDGKIYKTLNKGCANLAGNRAVCQLIEDGDLVYEIVYLHVLDIYCSVGDYVCEGQPLCNEGNTGACWTAVGGTIHELTLEERLVGVGSHLHFGFKPCKKVLKLEEGKTYLMTEFGEKYFDGFYYEVLFADNGLDGFIDPTPYFYTPTLSQILENIKRSLLNIFKSL